jgi:hypothetical protein
MIAVAGGILLVLVALFVLGLIAAFAGRASYFREQRRMQEWRKLQEDKARPWIAKGTVAQ